MEDQDTAWPPPKKAKKNQPNMVSPPIGQGRHSSREEQFRCKRTLIIFELDEQKSQQSNFKKKKDSLKQLAKEFPSLIEFKHHRKKEEKQEDFDPHEETIFLPSSQVLKEEEIHISMEENKLEKEEFKSHTINQGDEARIQHEKKTRKHHEFSQ